MLRAVGHLAALKYAGLGQKHSRWQGAALRSVGSLIQLETPMAADDIVGFCTASLVNANKKSVSLQAGKSSSHAEEKADLKKGSIADACTKVHKRLRQSMF